MLYTSIMLVRRSVMDQKRLCATSVDVDNLSGMDKILFYGIKKSYRYWNIFYVRIVYYYNDTTVLNDIF